MKQISGFLLVFTLLLLSSTYFYHPIMAEEANDLIFTTSITRVRLVGENLLGIFVRVQDIEGKLYPLSSKQIQRFEINSKIIPWWKLDWEDINNPYSGITSIKGLASYFRPDYQGLSGLDWRYVREKAGAGRVEVKKIKNNLNQHESSSRYPKIEIKEGDLRRFHKAINALLISRKYFLAKPFQYSSIHSNKPKKNNRKSQRNKILSNHIYKLLKYSKAKLSRPGKYYFGPINIQKSKEPADRKSVRDFKNIQFQRVTLNRKKRIGKETKLLGKKENNTDNNDSLIALSKIKRVVFLDAEIVSRNSKPGQILHFSPADLQVLPGKLSKPISNPKNISSIRRFFKKFEQKTGENILIVQLPEDIQKLDFTLDIKLSFQNEEKNLPAVTRTISFNDFDIEYLSNNPREEKNQWQKKHRQLVDSWSRKDYETASALGSQILESKKDLKSIMSIPMAANWTYLTAMSFDKMGNKEMAGKYFDQFIKLYPHSRHFRNAWGWLVNNEFGKAFTEIN